jgi:hypothetical protein
VKIVASPITPGWTALIALLVLKYLQLRARFG